MRSLFAIRPILALALVGLVVAGPLTAQQADPGTVVGQVTQEDGTPLASARVVATSVQTGRQFGALSTADGTYVIIGLPPGSYRVEVRLIGYNTGRVDRVVVASAESTTTDFLMGTAVIALDALEVFATRAIERETPVAFSDVNKEQLEQQMASQDLPLVMNVTPSAYATESGGAKGDSRINVRGFNQRNVAVMINGVPVNDMENGWVYWSNWDGIGDATSSIQMQRGLSAVNLATPSIGGTLNIITDATALAPGGGLKQEFGSEGYIKTTGSLATGMVGDFAFSLQGTYQDGNGLPNGAWNTGWSYYLGASWAISAKNRLDLFALGAPQRHGQRLYAQNIAAYDSTFALSLDSYDPAAARDPDGYIESRDGHDFNENWNTVSESYTGQQAAGSSLFDRKLSGSLNERENFFHKPQVNLNWHSQFSSSLSLSTVSYYSGGNGGGTGTLGNFEWDYSSQPSRIADWDGNVRINSGELDDRGDPKPAGRSDGILRNSRNNQWTIGLISKLKKQFDSPLTMEIGVDWRTAEIDHFREVRDLLGGNYYLSDDNEFEGEQQRQLGDLVDYNFTNTVDWLGGFVQAEYSTSKYTVFGMGGLSTINYKSVNHFLDDGTGNELVMDPDNYLGGQIKAGGLYNLTDQWGLFVNAGYISKVPNLDAVMLDEIGAINPNAQNEKFYSFEGGANYGSVDRSLVLNLNAYFTQWNDRTITFENLLDEFGDESVVTLLGLDARHMGLEAELNWRLSNIVSLNGAASLADWEYTDDVSGTVRSDPGSPIEPLDLYVKGLKVGDAPQVQFVYGATVFPTRGLFVQLLGRTYAKNYSQFEALGRDDPDDVDGSGNVVQSWQAPGYTTFDAHLQFAFPESFRLGNRTMLFAHVLNVFNSTYIIDSIDNSSFNGWDDDHDADDAEVHLGLGTRFNVGVQFNF